MYHISDVKNFNKCKRLFQKNICNNSASFNMFVRIEKNIIDLVIKKLRISDYFKGEANDDKSLALKQMNEKDWLVNSRFEYNNLRIKVPFLHKKENKWDVYFLYIGNFPKDDDLLFYQCVIWVLYKNNIDLNNLYVIHLNSEYIRNEELNLDELFIISENFYNKNNNIGKSLNSLFLNKKFDFEKALTYMNELEKMDFVDAIKVKACTKVNKCIYYDECFQNENVEDNSILTLVSSQNKTAMYDSGIRYLKDANINLIEGTRKQFAQIKADINGGLFFDKLALYTWKKRLKFPLIFLDFEWETYAIPPYKGMKPYDVLLFQYSIHIYDGEKIEHKEFIKTGDSREEIIQSLLNDIPEHGSILAYNSEAAEKIRIKELAKFNVKYSDKLLKIVTRMVDLQFPFESGIIYDVRMKGQYSLKTLMNILDKDGYHKLDISQGIDAVYSFRKIDEIDDENEKQNIINSLKEYCSMDTYAMYVVYKWIDSLQ